MQPRRSSVRLRGQQGVNLMPKGLYVRSLRGPYKKADISTRFWQRVDPCRTDGCAVWVGTLTSTGYGSFWDGVGGVMAHHFLVGGPVQGMQWDHLCRNRACVWPGHLELVTPAINVQRAVAAKPRQTHCKRGHLLDGPNLGTLPSGRHWCRACHRYFYEKRRQRR